MSIDAQRRQLVELAQARGLPIVALARQVREKAPYLVLMAAALILAAPVGIAANPAEIGLLGLVGHMLEAQHVPGGLDGLG